MAFVGNGFDIQALHDHEAPVDTRYASFYHFLKLRSFNPENVILKEMEQLREQGKENWSDVEALVGRLLETRVVSAVELSDALRDLQGEFSEFLGLAVPSQLLERLGNDSMERSLAMGSLTSFLGDLDPDDYRHVKLLAKVDNFDIYNFVFVNFNYTPLLDDYIYLDQTQFDPLPLKTVDRNFSFAGNPKNVNDAAIRAGDTFSSYLMTEVMHPHGQQAIPRSLLFGIDMPSVRNGNQDRSLRLAKPFWAQNERRYKHLFDDTELFIIFGCSLGDSDRWWWRHIADSLGQWRERPRPNQDEADRYQPELIIYWYDPTGTATKDSVRNAFSDAAGVTNPDLGEYIHIVLYDDSTDRVWLNTSRG